MNSFSLMSASPEHGGKRIVFLGADRRENAMRRFAFGREVPSLRGDKGKLAYTRKSKTENRHPVF